MHGRRGCAHDFIQTYSDSITQLLKYMKLDQKGSAMAEYIWIDSTGGVRSKSKVSHHLFCCWITPLSDSFPCYRDRGGTCIALVRTHPDHEPTRAQPGRNEGATLARSQDIQTWPVRIYDD